MKGSDMLDETIISFDGDELAANVFMKKYAYKNEKTLDEMKERLTDAIMSVEII